MSGALELRDLARTVAADISTFLLAEVDQVHGVDTKSSATDLVTEIDRASEARIVAAITAQRPSDGFKGEEGTDASGTSGVRWIIDPIDGTANFVLGHPGYGVSIAAEVDGTVVAGAVGDPVHGQLFDAALGHGARCNGEPLAVRPTSELSRAVVATGFSFRPERRRTQAQALTTILPQVADIRRMGSAALDLCGVAVGRVDAYYELGLNEWDLAAGALIAAEAGADVRMPDLTAAADGVIVASAPGVTTQLLDVLGKAGVL